MLYRKLRTAFRLARNGKLSFVISVRFRELWWDRVIAPTRSQWETSIQPGLRMLLPTNQYLSRKIFMGTHEADESEFITSFLGHGDIFLDVGANIGYFTLLASSNVGGEGEVHAFEPSPSTFEILRRNVVINRLNNVHLNRLGLSDLDEVRELHVSLDGLSSFDTFGSPACFSNFVLENVHCTTLDRYKQEVLADKAITLIKIDVEGWERRVLLGGKSLLEGRDAPVLLVEFADGIAAQAGESCGELRRTLLDLGYKLYHYYPRSPEARILVEERTLADKYKCNLVAAKDISIVSQRLQAIVT